MISRWSILARNFDGTLLSVRISPVLHPAMLLTFTDGTSLQQHGNRPTAVLAVRGFGDVENGSSVCRSPMLCSIEKPLYRLSAHG
jgi:hypothetical protein